MRLETENRKQKTENRNNTIQTTIFCVVLGNPIRKTWFFISMGLMADLSIL
jgi:hypothetical protein